ncbi:MAG: hypothetical protein FWD42_00955 [Solirubrobacterales bacterium]|nr:hypothetical protein [Solirubrobacterales bacterium]
MLAYLTWHRPAQGVDAASYEGALERLHRSLAARPPSGFRGSALLRTEEPGWLSELPARGDAGGPVYEDWYLLDGWSAVGVLEEAAVSRGHVSAHDAVARLAGDSAAGVYRLCEGSPALGDARIAAWVRRAPGHEPPTLAALLGDGMAGESAGLWRRALGLGPAPEHCLVGPEAPVGTSPARLPAGWSVEVLAREVLWSGC